MKCWVLLHNQRAARVYLSEARALADYELANGVRSESDFFELNECPIFSDESHDPVHLLKILSWGGYTGNNILD